MGQSGSGVDLLMGVGGTPEAVIAACALRCNGAALFGRLHPRDEAKRTAALGFGHDLVKVLTTRDLVWGDNVFIAASGVTDGSLLRGVRVDARGSTRNHFPCGRGRVRSVRSTLDTTARAPT